MLSKIVIRVIIAGTTGYVAKEAIVAKFDLTNPALLIALPVSILRHGVVPCNYPNYICPNRQELHKHCSDANWFDNLTVIPINSYLDKQNIRLSQESLKAIKSDIAHTKQMSSEDPMHKKIQDYFKQADHQREIAHSFHKSGEPEGALMHSILAGCFNIRASLSGHVDHSSNSRDPSN